jgi:hypothetical protein
MREFKDGVSGMEASVTEPESALPAQLPSTTSSPSASKIAQDLQSLSDEDKQAIVDALKSSEQPSAPESERETVS